MSNREETANGYLRVANCVITGEAVNEYLGREVPNWQELGLIADAIYSVYRPLDELEKSINEWNGLQLLDGHIPVDVNSPKMDMVVGAVGTDPKIDGGDLVNDITLYDKATINNLDVKKDLSAGYSYEPVMENGTFGGKSYSIRMTNIKGNHVAIVKDGRHLTAQVADSNNLIGRVKLNIKNLLSGFTFKRGTIVGDAALDKATVESIIELSQNGVEADDIVAKLAEAVEEGAVVEDTPETNEPPAAVEEPKAEPEAAPENNEVKQALAKIADLEKRLIAVEGEATESLAMDSAKTIARKLIGNINVVGDSADAVITKALMAKGVNSKGKTLEAKLAMGEALVASSSNSKPILVGDGNKSSDLISKNSYLSQIRGY